MKPQLYLPEMDKRYLKDQIGRFVEVYNLKLNSVFNNIGAESDEHGERFFQDVMNSTDYADSIDPSCIAEEATDLTIQHFTLLNHGRYVLICAWHVALYEAFEQQLRLFLFKELAHEFNITINYIPTKFDDLKKFLIPFKIDLNLLAGLKQIDHLRLICNVVKHGEGLSAENLRKKRPDLIKTFRDKDLLELNGSSLLDEVLAINDETLTEFGNTIEKFWDSFPERSFCEKPEALLRLLIKQKNK